jgi:hypothetical protein
LTPDDDPRHLYDPVLVALGGANEIAGRFSFPGTYAVRSSTLRAVFVDLGRKLGDQGFRMGVHRARAREVVHDIRERRVGVGSDDQVEIRNGERVPDDSRS